VKQLSSIRAVLELLCCYGCMVVINVDYNFPGNIADITSSVVDNQPEYSRSFACDCRVELAAV